MDDELTHHGVKGMKWGIRRYQNNDGTLTEAGKKRYSDSDNISTVDKNKQNTVPVYNRSDQHSKTETRSTKQERKVLIKNRRNLSDEELNALIKRLNAEKQLKALYDEDLRAGQSTVKKIMSEVGTKTLSSVLTSSLSVVALYAIGSKLGKTKFDPKEVGAAIVKKAIGGDKNKNDDDEKKDKNKKDDLKKREEDLKKREEKLKLEELKKREEDLKKREEELKKKKDNK